MKNDEIVHIFKSFYYIHGYSSVYRSTAVYAAFDAFFYSKRQQGQERCELKKFNDKKLYFNA